MEGIEAAFRRASAALDEAWQLVRELRLLQRGVRVDTISSSLANPLEYQVEMTMSNARIVIQGEGDRTALTAVCQAACVQGLISEDALARILKEYD